MTKQRTLLAFHAHPDDESSKGSGTMAKYSHEGARVVLVCATDGGAGDILNPRMDKPGIKERMPELRKAELETACDILGVSDLYYMGYPDSGMPDSPENKNPEAFCNVDSEKVMSELVKIIREVQPEVLLSYDESRGYDHPDHVRVYELGLRAFKEAGDPDKFPEAGEPWSPKKLYFFATFTKQRFVLLNDAAVAEGQEPPYQGWIDSWDDMGFEEPEITSRIDVADYIELRTKALLAHATQIDPDSFWFAVPDEIHKKVYPWEDYTLIESTVETELPEDDLFAGIE